MFQLENRHQDSGWNTLGDKYRFASIDQAIFTAADCASDAMIFGMVRVIDEQAQEVIVTFPAGGGNV